MANRECNAITHFKTINLFGTDCVSVFNGEFRNVYLSLSLISGDHSLKRENPQDNVQSAVRNIKQQHKV